MSTASVGRAPDVTCSNGIALQRAAVAAGGAAAAAEGARGGRSGWGLLAFGAIAAFATGSGGIASGGFGAVLEALDFGPLQEAVDAHFDARQFVAFLGRDEGVSHALAAHAAGAADAVHVVVAELGDIVVDDV